MKVLHLVGGGDGGAKTHVLSLVKELNKHMDVKIISFRPGIFADEARILGIDVEVIKTGNIFLDIKRVIAIIRKNGYEIIHSHGAKANLISMITGFFVKVPTVTTVHSDYKLDYMHSVFKKLTFGTINTIALRFIKYKVAVSRNFKDMLIKRRFNGEKVFVLYNGIDLGTPIKNYSKEEFIKKYNLSLNPDDITVSILARLNPVKGIDTLINAAKVVTDKNKNVKFLIAGDGEDRRELERKTDNMELSNKVFFLGWLNDPYELISNTDINTLTSISETFPYSILEGARLQKAIISSRVGGVPDLIDHGKNGYMFEPGDFNKLAEYILELASDNAKRKKMGEKLFQKVETQFSVESMCKTQLNIYKTILDRELHELK